MCCITVDRTEFPLLRVNRLGLDVHLFPVFKVQFEVFLAQQHKLGDTWYAEVLSQSPRCSWRQVDTVRFEDQFLTAILPDEIDAFARWLGPKFRLPSVAERQRLQRLWTDISAVKTARCLETMVSGSEVARILSHTLESRGSATLADLSLMVDGVMEWVHGTRSPKLLGQPRESFSKQLFDGLTPVSPTNLCSRNRLFGCRLVSDIQRT